MTTPTPAQLRGYAHDLRGLASGQRTHATQCDGLFAAVSKLADTNTWSGTWPEETNTRIKTWARGLTNSAGQMRTDATSWDRTADDFDHKAAEGAKSGS